MTTRFCPIIFSVIFCAHCILDAQNTGNRRFSNTFLGYDKNQSVISAVDSSLDQGDFNASLAENLKILYSSINDGQYLAAYDFTIDYLIQTRNLSQSTPLNISDDNLLGAVQAVTSVFLEESFALGVVDDSFHENTSRILLENFITDPSGQTSVDLSVSDRLNKFSSIYFNSINASDVNSTMEDGVSGFFQSALALYGNTNPNGIDFNQTDLNIGIESVSKLLNVESETMMFGGTDGFYNFDPEKTNFVNKAAFGITESFLDSYYSSNSSADSNLTENSVPFDLLTKSILKGVYSYADDIGSIQNKDFVLELLKSTTSGITEGSTTVFFSNTNLSESGQAIDLSEEISVSLSKNGILLVSEMSLDGIEYNDVAEAISFGTSMGARIMGDNMDDIMSLIDPKLTNPQNTRKLLSKALSSGSSHGSLVAIANIASVDPNVGWDEVKEVSSQSAKGSMIANVANVIYFGDEDELLPIINFSAQGATYGATKTLELNNVEKPQGLTEDLTVEVARASSNGSSFGATFSSVGLKNAKPITNENDVISTKATQAVAYGATIGSILGASVSGNGDPIVVKQASKQGVTEGSLIGSGFATDYQDTFFVDKDYEDMEIAAKQNMLSTINSMNSSASIEAMNSLATKKVKTSSRDMLLLIRKFNISPNTTNPATIYQRPSKNKSGDDLPFTDKFPAATPI